MIILKFALDTITLAGMEGRMRRVFSVFWTLGLLLPLLLPTPALAARLHLEPIEILGYEGDKLRLSVELACGSSFYGLLASLDDERTLRVAAVVEQGAIVCTSFPEARELVVDFLATRGVSRIAPMEVDERRSRVTIAPITAIKAAPRKNGVSRLKVAYEPRCGEALGTIIRRAGPKRLEIGMAERPYELAELTSCQARSRVALIRSLSLTPGTRVTSLRRAARSSLSRAYELRLAAIEPGSVKRLAPFGGVAVSFKRACNEAPLGIVLGGNASEPRVGVVVARYPNYHCPSGAKASEWSSLMNYDLKLPKQARLTALRPGEATVQIALPARYARTAPGLDVRYVGGCSRALGVVYAHDDKGKLALGIVSRQAASSCKGTPAEVSLFQPFVGKHVLTQDLAPLKLKG
jgi:hypothetical protein